MYKFILVVPESLRVAVVPLLKMHGKLLQPLTSNTTFVKPFDPIKCVCELVNCIPLAEPRAIKSRSFVLLTAILESDRVRADKAEKGDKHACNFHCGEHLEFANMFLRSLLFLVVG